MNGNIQAVSVLLDLPPELRPVRQRRFDGIPVLVQHALDGVESLVHPRQLARVQVEFVEVARQVERTLLQPDRRVAQSACNGFQVLVERCQLGDDRRHHFQSLEDGAVGLVQGAVNAAGVLLQLLDVGEHRRPRPELFVLTRVQLRRVNFVGLEAIELQLLLAERPTRG